MKHIADFFQRLFAPGEWSPGYGDKGAIFFAWLYIAGGVLVAINCYKLLILLYKGSAKNKGVEYRKLYRLLTVFFIAAGSSSLLGAALFWEPLYRVAAVSSFVLALFSWLAVMALVKFFPASFSLKANAELEKEMAQRKRAEEQLLISERRFKSLVQEGGDLIGILDENGYYQYVSPTTSFIMGVAPEEFIGKNALSLIHPDDLPKVEACFAQLQGEKRVEVDAFRFRHGEGEWRWYETVLTNLLDDPAVAGIVVNSRDVTERVRKDELIRQRNAELNKIFDYSRDIICAIDGEGRFVRMSRASQATLGYSPEELIGRSYVSLLAEEDVARTLAIATEIMNGKQVTDFENTYLHKEGFPVFLTWSARWDREDGLMYCIARNATEKVRLERAVQKEQERFARLFAEAPLSMCILKGPQHVFEDANELYSVLTGRRNIKGKTAREVFPELEGQGYFNWLDEVFQTGQTFSGRETPLSIDLNGDGNVTDRFINFIYQPYFDQDGKVQGIYYFGTDVTEQVIMRRRVEQSEKRFRSLIEYSHDILVLVDAGGVRRYVSPAFERTFGYKEEAIVGERVFDKVHPDDAELAAGVIQKVKAAPGGRVHLTARFRHREGHYIWVAGEVTNMLEVEGINALVLNFKDIDETKKAEEEKELTLRVRNAFLQENRLSDSLARVLEELSHFTHATYAEAWTTSIDNKNLQLAAQFSEERVLYPSNEVFSIDKGLAGKAWQTRVRLFIENVQESELYYRADFARAHSLSSALAIPVIFSEKVTAVLVLYNLGLERAMHPDWGQELFSQLASEIQRKRAERELERFFNMSGDMLGVAGFDGYFKKVNPAFTKVLGYSEEEFLTTPFLDFVHEEDRSTSSIELQKLGEGRETFNFQNRYITKSGEVRDLVWTVTPVQKHLMLAVAKDITEIRKFRKEAEQASRRISIILESITDAFFAVDQDFVVTYWNKQAARLVGVPPEAVIGKNLWDVFPEAVSLKFYSEYHKALQTNQSVRFEEYFEPSKSWFDVSAYPSDEGLSIYFRDITAAKKDYHDLVKTETDVRNFARQLNTVLEEERSRIAREIHDEFGQQLAGIKMSLSWVKKQVTPEEKACQQLNDIMQDVDETMQSLRSFATELRPGILDTMGLFASLEWLAKEFEKKTGLNCFVNIDATEQEFTKTFSTCYFRICQEALTNILKHSGARNVVIQVFEEEGQLVLEIIDDGIGIVEDKIQNPFSMGILGMRERAHLIEGNLDIRRGVFEGTIIHLKARVHAH